MKVIGPAAHRMLDYVTVVLFAVAPALLGLTGVPATLAYVLAAVHLVLTLVTRFPGAAPRPVPFAMHGIVEMLVGPLLILLGVFAGWTGNARSFYLAIGIVIFVVWILSNYAGDSPLRDETR